MFCTIEDAWGLKDLQHSAHSSFTNTKSINSDNTFNKEMFEQSDKPDSFKSNEYTFEDKNNNYQEKSLNNEKLNNEKSKQDMYNQYMELREMFDGNLNNNEVKDSEVCLALDNHLSKCARCRSKYLVKLNNQQYNNPMSIDFSKINLNLDSNKDAITIFLFGLLIILLLQLFSSK